MTQMIHPPVVALIVPFELLLPPPAPFPGRSLNHVAFSAGSASVRAESFALQLGFVRDIRFDLKANSFKYFRLFACVVLEAQIKVFLFLLIFFQFNYSPYYIQMFYVIYL